MNYNSLLVENELPTWCTEPKNWTGAASTGVWISLKNFNSVAFLIQTGAWAAGSVAITVTQASAVAGTGEKALTLSINGYSGSAGATQANLWTSTSATGVLTTAAIASNTFNLDTANKLYIFEIYTRSLDLANNFTCVRLKGASPGANADFYGATYVLRQPRFMQSLTAMPNPFVD